MEHVLVIKEQIFIISQFSISEESSWVPLVQGLSQDCNQGVSQSVSHLKTRLGESASKLACVAVGRPQFLTGS